MPIRIGIFAKCELAFKNPFKSKNTSSTLCSLNKERTCNHVVENWDRAPPRCSSHLRVHFSRCLCEKVISLRTWLIGKQSFPVNHTNLKAKT